MPGKLIVSNDIDFKRVYNQYYKALVGYAYTFLNDQKACEDLVQDIYYTLWVKSQEFNDEISLRVYLYRSTHNKCINYIRHQHVKNEYSKDQINSMDNDEDLMKRMLKEEVYRLLYKCINELSEKRKEVILLNLKGYSNIEISEELGISVDTVKTHKKKVYAILREKMKDHAFFLYMLLGL